MKKIKKLLVANRGEIASRVFATCRELGISTVAIYSKYDAPLLFVKEADEAILLEGETLKETYLNSDRILNIAKKLNVDAIHPGYGFLSENAQFAENVLNAGLIFIGPKAKNISSMGNKSESKFFLKPLGVPFIPGYFGKEQDINFLRDEAKKIGLPLLIKAAAGGGGKGMKIVENWNEFDQKFEEAKAESLKSFGDDHLMLEKYLVNPRHIEVQVFGDEHGNAIHFHERDCSLQRRHQKVVEEAPAPGLTQQQRDALFADALKIVNAMKYENAGTMEFIMDDKGVHYFLEMNTRLQVEHPVSEAINGVDLVKLQIKVAEGEIKPWEKIHRFEAPHGHSIEVRVYAEDPENNFMPTSGKIKLLKFSTIKNVRYDFSYFQGDQITVNFDPMIGKVIVWAETRQDAIHKLIAALKETVILGFKTNISFLIACLSKKEFQQGLVSTFFIQKHHDNLMNQEMPNELVVAGYLLSRFKSSSSLDTTNDPWLGLDNFRI